MAVHMGIIEGEDREPRRDTRGAKCGHIVEKLAHKTANKVRLQVNAYTLIRRSVKAGVYSALEIQCAATLHHTPTRREGGVACKVHQHSQEVRQIIQRYMP